MGLNVKGKAKQSTVMRNHLDHTADCVAEKRAAIVKHLEALRGVSSDGKAPAEKDHDMQTLRPKDFHGPSGSGTSESATKRPK